MKNEGCVCVTKEKLCRGREGRRLCVQKCKDRKACVCESVRGERGDFKSKGVCLDKLSKRVTVIIN